MHWDDVVHSGGVAVVTGGASGVGLAAARHLGAVGFELLLADVSKDTLEAAGEELRAAGARVTTAVVDVSDAAALDRLADAAFGIGPVAVLMNNAGISLPSKSWDAPEHWRRLIDVNFFGILNGVQSFVPRMIVAARPAPVINTGSKQGITTPPGNPAYNASKAAVKVLTEQLAHELREAGAPISAHLFVPGFTYTGMIAARIPEKPDGAWTSEQTVAHLFDKVAQGDFYVLCPDNMVTPEQDAKRVTWAAQDIAQNRPALSRWHADFGEAFKAYERDGRE